MNNEQLKMIVVAMWQHIDANPDQRCNLTEFKRLADREFCQFWMANQPPLVHPVIGAKGSIA